MVRAVSARRDAPDAELAPLRRGCPTAPSLLGVITDDTPGAQIEFKAAIMTTSNVYGHHLGPNFPILIWHGRA